MRPYAAYASAKATRPAWTARTTEPEGANISSPGPSEPARCALRISLRPVIGKGKRPLRLAKPPAAGAGSEGPTPAP